MSCRIVEYGAEDVGAVDGGFDAAAVVLLQHPEVFVAELVGRLFDGKSGAGHEAGGGVAEVWRSRLGVQWPSMPAAVMVRLSSVRTALGSEGLPVGEVNT
ncbi:MAG TPA: hypothetical protein VMM60_10290, partial [Ilumatobacter sp.]|nr:hypothetical protein [Ilumatobacter sp.]